MDVPTSRIRSLDALRGAVMILMALDHIRDFIHRGAMSFSPTDLTRTTPALFFTRWVTHFCAPVFMFAAGAGAFLWWQRNHSKGQLSRFLWTRGLWLIILEVTVVRFGWFFDFDYSRVVFQVIWAIGASMVFLSGLVFLPTAAITAVGVALIAGHNLLDGISPARFGAFGWLWCVLHVPRLPVPTRAQRRWPRTTARSPNGVSKQPNRSPPRSSANACSKPRSFPRRDGAMS